MEQLGESYLYAFGWDVKFCDAIEEFFDEQQTKNFQRSEYPPVIFHLMRTFYNEDCSKVTFQLLHYCFFPTSIPTGIHGPKLWSGGTDTISAINAESASQTRRKRAVHDLRSGSSYPFKTHVFKMKVTRIDLTEMAVHVNAVMA